MEIGAACAAVIVLSAATAPKSPAIFFSMMSLQNARGTSSGSTQTGKSGNWFQFRWNLPSFPCATAALVYVVQQRLVGFAIAGRRCRGVLFDAHERKLCRAAAIGLNLSLIHI